MQRWRPNRGLLDVLRVMMAEDGPAHRRIEDVLAQLSSETGDVDNDARAVLVALGYVTQRDARLRRVDAQPRSRRRAVVPEISEDVAPTDGTEMAF